MFQYLNRLPVTPCPTWIVGSDHLGHDNICDTRKPQPVYLLKPQPVLPLAVL